MKAINLYSILLGSLLMLSLGLRAQPTDNPYRTRYTPDINHWTDSLNWSAITNVNQVPSLVVNGNVDSSILAQTMDLISATGGGVLYFPAGTYNFTYEVEIPSGVIWRGDAPNVADGKDTTYDPPTDLVFPQYIPTFSGSGTPNKTAFKEILSKPNAHHIALVNLDINRAGIRIHPHAWQLVTTRQGNTYWPADLPSHVLVYGIRSNNVALTSPAVPTVCQTNNNGGWNRWPWGFAANVDLYVAANGIVVNCRMNDNTTDDFLQPGYSFHDGVNCTVSSLCNSAPTDGREAPFLYTDHYGIVINRGKVNKDGPSAPSNFSTGPNAPWGIYPWITYGQPDTEPDLFRPGMEIMDNWVYHTQRIGIQAAGSGLKVLRNSIRDKGGKVQWTHATGTRCGTNNAATFENRGIDISGWDVEVAYNSVLVEQTAIRNSGFLSVDGEGILVQECCGGTSVKNYAIHHNDMVAGRTGYIGLWGMRDLYNVRIDSNNLGCDNILLYADLLGSGASFHRINNCTIRNNSNVGSIDVRGTEAGNAFFVENNASCSPGATLRVPCYATVTGNTGFTPAACTQPSNPNITFPTLTITSPVNNDTASVGRQLLVTFNSTDADSVQLLVNSQRYSAMADPLLTPNFPFDISRPGNYVLSLLGKNSQAISYSNSVTIRVPTVGLAERLGLPYLSLFPNPARDQVNLAWGGQETEPLTVLLTDLSGRVLKRETTQGSGHTLSLSGLATGTYLVAVERNGQRWYTRLVKE